MQVDAAINDANDDATDGRGDAKRLSPCLFRTLAMRIWLKRSSPGRTRTTADLPGNTALLERGGAIGGATGSVDVDLQTIIDTWPNLSGATRAEIMAEVRTKQNAAIMTRNDPADGSQP